MDDVNTHRSWWPNLARIQVGTSLKIQVGTPIKTKASRESQTGRDPCRDTHQEFQLGQTGTPIKNNRGIQTGTNWDTHQERKTVGVPSSRGRFLNCGEKIKNPGTMESRKAAREWAPGCRGRFAWRGWRSGIPGFGPSWFPGESTAGNKLGHPSKRKTVGVPNSPNSQTHTGTPIKNGKRWVSQTQCRDTHQMRTETPSRNSNLDKPGHPSKTTGEFKLERTGTPIKNEKRWVSQAHAGASGVPNSQTHTGTPIKNGKRWVSQTHDLTALVGVPNSSTIWGHPKLIPQTPKLIWGHPSKTENGGCPKLTVRHWWVSQTHMGHPSRTKNGGCPKLTKTKNGGCPKLTREVLELRRKNQEPRNHGIQEGSQGMGA
ncbi:hypothetical protein SCOR_30785 [Sulfidibacter corallicola]